MIKCEILCFFLFLFVPTCFGYKIIDSFNLPASKTYSSVTSAKKWSNTGTSSDFIGGVRDGYINRVNTTTGKTNRAKAKFSGGQLSVIANRWCASKIRLTYDGTAGGKGTFPVTTFPSVDLSDETQFSFRFTDISKKPDFTKFLIKVHQGGSNYHYDAVSDINAWIDANISLLPATFSVPFSNFGGGSAMDDVTAIRVLLITDTKNADYSLDFIAATGEPKLLWALSLTSILLYKIRRKR